MEHNSYVIKPHLQQELPVISHGKGIYLYDTNGKQYIDGCSGAVTASIGHGIEEIRDAMMEQAKKVSFVYRTQFTSTAVEELALKLKEWAPGDVNWSFFVNSGSEATETAIKIAVQYWREKGAMGKNKVLSRWMSYHGITLGALSVSGHAMRRRSFVPLLDHLPMVSAPSCYRCPLGLSFPSCQTACVNELERAINRVGAEHIAAFIAEPIIGASGGAVVPPPHYYQEVRRLCDKYDILFIADEVMTGIGRTGKAFGIDHWGIVPDIITLGKGMTAGYTPMAATMVSQKIIDVIINGSASITSGHTFSSNPQSAAVALAVLTYMEKHDLINQAKVQGDYLKLRLEEMKSTIPLVGDVRGIGLLWGIEVVADPYLQTPFSLDLGITSRIIKRATEKGLLVYPAIGGYDGVAGDSILIAPPLTVKKEEIDKIIDILKETLIEIQHECIQEGIFDHFQAG